ncbi:MAG: hypothetical protein IT311_08240 [Anaerolineales bacterium]|nr:hypothetical protein [Anaerolineales bacterium]MCZ2122027.1 putative zinc-binding metallopeptidase [Anaerolineales bacterium]
MNRLKILLAAFALFFSVLACQTFADDETAEEEWTTVTEAPATEAPATEAPASEDSLVCPALINQVMELASGTGEEAETVPTKFDEEVTLVTYTVNGDEISDPKLESVSADLEALQADEAAQKQVWEYYAAIIPADYRTSIVEYSIFTDGMYNTLASVVQTQNDPEKWALQIDLADSNNYYILTPTLLHEFAHLLSLGSNQIPPSLAVFNNPEDNDIYLKELSACPNYFATEGCAKPDSYINAFYNQFWADLHDEWSAINREEDPNKRQEQLDAFYTKYEDHFISSYAATSPEEDLAESWSVFIINTKAEGDSIMEQKNRFFYNYPELVELRSKILNNICTALPEYEK